MKQTGHTRKIDSNGRIIIPSQLRDELNIKGDLPKSGTITVDSSCNVTLSVNNGDFCATKALDSDSVLVGDIEAGECVIDEEDNPVIVKYRIK